jgi:hypothetical protein
MIGFFILGFVGSIFCLVLAAVNKVWNGFFYGLWFAECALIAFISVIVIKSEPVPKAIDVYCGRTTLEITYKDSVAVDSVVVFK